MPPAVAMSDCKEACMGGTLLLLSCSRDRQWATSFLTSRMVLHTIGSYRFPFQDVDSLACPFQEDLNSELLPEEVSLSGGLLVRTAFLWSDFFRRYP